MGRKLRPKTKFQILFDQFGMSGKIFNFCDNIYCALKSYRTISLVEERRSNYFYGHFSQLSLGS